MEVADWIRQGVSALRSGQAERAIELLRPAADHASMQQDDLQDIRARVLSLLAQASLLAGQLDEAERWIRQAVRVAHGLDQPGAPQEMRTLQEAIRAARSQQHQVQQQADAAAKVADMPLDNLLSDKSSPQERSEVLIQKANALLDVARASEALSLGRQALQTARAAGLVREEVLAQLTIARADPAEARGAILAAWQRADGASNTTLISAVARVADLTKVKLPSPSSVHDVKATS